MAIKKRINVLYDKFLETQLLFKARRIKTANPKNPAAQEIYEELKNLKRKNQTVNLIVAAENIYNKKLNDEKSIFKENLKKLCSPKIAGMIEERFNLIDARIENPTHLADDFTARYMHKEAPIPPELMTPPTEPPPLTPPEQANSYIDDLDALRLYAIIISFSNKDSDTNKLFQKHDVYSKNVNYIIAIYDSLIQTPKPITKNEREIIENALSKIEKGEKLTNAENKEFMKLINSNKDKINNNEKVQLASLELKDALHNAFTELNKPAQQNEPVSPTQDNKKRVKPLAIAAQLATKIQKRVPGLRNEEMTRSKPRKGRSH